MIPALKNMSSDDFKHIRWLLKMMFKSFFRGNLKDAVEASYWIRIHMSYTSKKIK